jgi:purine nucleoside permease
VAIKQVNSKLGIRTDGPYCITQMHTYGTVTIERRLGMRGRINICRIIPMRQLDVPAL